MTLPRTRRWLIVVALALSSHLASAQSPYKILHAFTGGLDGGGTWSTPVLDQAGNLYGTTSGGGTDGYGVVFELTPQQDGQWFETVVYDFPNPRTHKDPASPFAGPILAPNGSLYGDTQLGGSYGFGAIFELTPNMGGWDFSALYSFGAPGQLGCCPWSALFRDVSDNLYGTGGGVAFKLSPSIGGWSEAVLHQFTGLNGDGYGPQAGVVSDTAGDLYGTTRSGGGSPACADFGCGTVYKLIPVFDGDGEVWNENILHVFGFLKGDGATPGLGSLAIDKKSALYGTTAIGGANGYGAVYKIAQSSTGHWQEIILHSFRQNDSNGFEPSGGVTLGPDGSLYGTTIAGGAQNCGCGVVYRLSPQPGGQWQYTVLHNFIGIDGAQPDANLTIDTQGNLYGTTLTGGPGGAGVVFELTP